MLGGIGCRVSVLLLLQLLCALDGGVLLWLAVEMRENRNVGQREGGGAGVE